MHAILSRLSIPLPDGRSEWGLMNNKRPFVPMIHSVRRESDDTLVGKMEPRGMSMRALTMMFGGGDVELPTIHLTLSRVGGT